MNRRRKFLLNTLSSITYQFLAIISGFILPKLFLEYYGSQVNGLVSSITQFLSIITLGELGIGAVIQSSLYKPLALGDGNEVSRIIKSSQVFFKKIVFMFLLYLGILIFIYPHFNENFTSEYTVFLMLAISVSSIAQYYFGMSYQLLLISDQKAYIPMTISIIVVTFNTVFSFLLIYNGATIHLVKWGSTIIFLLRPLLLNLYVRKKYRIDKNIELVGQPIKQKWNGVAQHVASYVLNNTDVIILTIFTSLAQVSIYTVYSLVVIGLRQVIMSLTTGMQSLFGNMLANEEFSSLHKRFSQYEWFIHTLVTIIFSCSAILIVPFVQVYTNGINDANYIQPLFGILLTFSMAAYCIRLPYNTMVLAAGHYKQTQKSAIIEMLINLIVSISLVSRYGLAGVALGTLLAMTYRTVYLAYYLKGNIINYRFKCFVKHLFVDLSCFFIMFLVFDGISLTETTYSAWIFLAIKVFVTSILIVFIINFLLNRQNLIVLSKKIGHRFQILVDHSK